MERGIKDGMKGGMGGTRDYGIDENISSRMIII